MILKTCLKDLKDTEDSLERHPLSKGLTFCAVLMIRIAQDRTPSNILNSEFVIVLNNIKHNWSSFEDDWINCHINQVNEINGLLS